MPAKSQEVTQQAAKSSDGFVISCLTHSHMSLKSFNKSETRCLLFEAACEIILFENGEHIKPKLHEQFSMAIFH